MSYNTIAWFLSNVLSKIKGQVVEVEETYRSLGSLNTEMLCKKGQQQLFCV